MAHVLIGFRNDLRLHDHAPLAKAFQSGARVIPVYCFDPRQFVLTRLAFAKAGTFRSQFLLESVANLEDVLKVIKCVKKLTSIKL